jgi:hypothetical protein
MPSIEYDVFICCREESGRDLAATIAASLRKRGFRVALDDRAAGIGRDERRLTLIDDTPDFILVLTPGALDACASDQDPVRIELAHALKTGTCVVAVSAPGYDEPGMASLPPDLAPLARRYRIAYHPERSRESLERIAHVLSSDTAIDERRLMRVAKWGFVMVGLVFLMVVANEAVPALVRAWKRPPVLPALPPFAIYWTGYGQRLENGQWREFTLDDGRPVQGADQFRLVFSPSADGFAYVLSLSQRGDVTVLFPGVTMRGASKVRAGQLYDAPPGAWTRVNEQAGLDTIFVVASYDPLENLEELAEDAGGDLSAGARRELLASTVEGLIDGQRQGDLLPRIWTRDRHPVSRSLAIGPGPATSTTTLASGVVVQHGMTARRGLVSAAVEIRVRRDSDR